MNRSILSVFAAASVLALFATGCAAGAETDASSGQEITSGATTPTAAPLTQVVTTTAGQVLANASGRSIYTFDPDTTSASTCYTSCAAHWPAVLVTATDVVTAPFATSPRTDGTTQLTLSGHPLYLFAGDSAQGDIKGDGLGGVWHLARPAPAPVTEIVDTTSGKVVANAAGRSLYTFDPDTTSASTCYTSCAAHWPPALVSATDVVAAPFATSPRTDHTTQLTLDGHPLYLFAGDSAKGDIKGDGLGGVWHLARPSAE